MPESGILQCIKSINETPAELKLFKGLAQRGSISITFIDNPNKDPNPLSPAVLAGIPGGDTFFGKLDARNIFNDKELRVKNYRIEADGTIDLVNGAETRYYICSDLNAGKNSQWTLKGEDELAIVNIDDAVWPPQQEGYLRNAVSVSANIFDVDPNINYQVDDTIRLGGELCKITGALNIGGPSALITINVRGGTIDYTNEISKTRTESHAAGDEIFPCEVADNERLDDMLERILLDIGINAARIPKADWTAEIDEWHPSTRLNTLWFEAEDVGTVIEKILTDFNLNLWFDPVAREIKLSAISVWKESDQQLIEGDQIDYDSIKKTKEKNLRATRASVNYKKLYLTDNDDVASYKKRSSFARTELEVPALYGKPKTKIFDSSFLLDEDSANLLTQRHVSRYLDPASFTWKTQERKRTFKTGDIVDVITDSSVGFSGLPTTGLRAQITQVKPVYKTTGREYDVKGFVYEPVFATGSEVVISGNIEDINLYIQYAGAPSQAVEITFILDGVSSGSTSRNTPSIRAGAFPVGSKIILIMANSADLQAKGGDGGRGQGAEFNTGDGWLYGPPPQDGEDGGTVIDAEGVDMDIYFSGATPSAAYPVAEGSITAPSGGSGGFSANVITETAGAGGKGGDGRRAGPGGANAQILIQAEVVDTSSAGADGTDDLNTGSFGLPGDNNNAFGGIAGSGVVDNGGTVTFFGSDALNYTNGNGDH